jgi:hypothetical protein
MSQRAKHYSQSVDVARAPSKQHLARQVDRSKVENIPLGQGSGFKEGREVGQAVLAAFCHPPSRVDIWEKATRVTRSVKSRQLIQRDLRFGHDNLHPQGWILCM